MPKKNAKNKWKNDKQKSVKDDALLKDSNQDQDFVENSLRTIYQEEEGEMPDMTKLEQIKSKRWIWMSLAVSALVLVLLLTAWAGFAYFKAYQGFNGTGLDLEVSGPEKIAIGQEITYFINYKNITNDPLAAVDLRINFPADFAVSDMRPMPNEQGNVWKIGALAAEERGTVKVRGTFTGALGSISAVQAIATYRPANYSSNFEAMATRQIEYSESVVTGFLQVPEKAVPGDNVSLIYHFENTGTDELKDVIVQFLIPEGFALNLEAMKTSSTTQGRVFEEVLGSLNPGDKKEFTVFGTFASGYGGDAEVEAKIGTRSKEGTFLPMHITEAVVPVLAGDLSLNFIVNGSEQQNRSVSYGDELRGIIGYENMADEDLNDVTIRLKAEAISLETGDVLGDKILINESEVSSTATSSFSNGQLVWNKDSLPDLENLASRESGSVEIGLPIVKSAPDKGAIALRLTVFADIKSVGETELNRTITMQPMTFVLLSDAKLAAEARYYTEEGAPMGSGPLPPKVGEKTTYRIIWRVNKSVHSLKDLAVMAKLPRSVDFGSIATTTAGEVSYNQAERTVSWSLNKMPADVNEIEAQFDVMIQPVAADDGRFATLMQDISLQAKDEDIDDSILLVINELNTDLQNDENAAGKGVVVK